MNGLGRPKFLEALLFVNNFAIRYTKGKGVRARLRYSKRKREREGEGCMMSKIEGRRKEGAGWLSECDLGREFTMQYQ